MGIDGLTDSMIVSLVTSKPEEYVVSLDLGFL